MKKQKLLTIYDLSKTLLLAEQVGKQKYFDRRQQLENMKPNDHYDKYSIFWRNGREEFLDHFFNKEFEQYDVAVWSSCDREQTMALTKSFFGRHYKNLLFVSAINRSQYDNSQNIEPISVSRDLAKIKEKFPQYDLHNTIMFSTHQNTIDLCKFNDVIIPQFCAKQIDLDSDITLQSIMKYLNGLSVLYNKNLVTDIRTALRSKRFAMMEKRVENSMNAREFM